MDDVMYTSNLPNLSLYPCLQVLRMWEDKVCNGTLGFFHPMARASERKVRSSRQARDQATTVILRSTAGGK